MESIVLALTRMPLPSSLYERLASSYEALRQETEEVEEETTAGTEL
jgi:hypothetical protein